MVSVGTGAAGRQVAQQLHPDLVLCDLLLPDISGEEVIEALDKDEALSGTPVMVVSGRANVDLRVRLLSGRVSDYVMKPFIGDELRARVANLLRNRLTLEELRIRAADAQRTASQLEYALQSRVVIEQAKGYLAAHHDVAVDHAFELLRGYARSPQTAAARRGQVRRGRRPPPMTCVALCASPVGAGYARMGRRVVGVTSGASPGEETVGSDPPGSEPLPTEAATIEARADLVLPLAEIPEAILRFAGTEPRVVVPSDSDDVEEDGWELLLKIFTQVHVRTGRDFSRYKRSTASTPT